MDKDRAKILDRIRKLLSLASNNPNEHEAASAASMAAKIAAKYNIDYAEVIESEIKKNPYDGIVEVPVEETNFQKRIPTYYNVLVTGVCETLGCQAAYCWFRHESGHQRPTMMVRGFKEDVIVAVWLCQYILRQIEQLADKSWKRNVLPDLQERGADVHASKRRSFKDTYKYGMVVTILDRVREVYSKQQEDSIQEARDANEESRVSAGTQLISLKNQLIVEVFGQSKTYASSGANLDIEVFAMGSLDADKVKINRVIETEAEEEQEKEDDEEQDQKQLP